MLFPRGKFFRTCNISLWAFLVYHEILLELFAPHQHIPVVRSYLRVFFVCDFYDRRIFAFLKGQTSLQHRFISYCLKIVLPKKVFFSFFRIFAGFHLFRITKSIVILIVRDQFPEKVTYFN